MCPLMGNAQIMPLEAISYLENGDGKKASTHYFLVLQPYLNQIILVLVKLVSIQLTKEIRVGLGVPGANSERKSARAKLLKHDSESLSE